MKAVFIGSTTLVLAGLTQAATPANWLGGNGIYTDPSKWSTGVAPTTSAFDAVLSTAGQVQFGSTATVNSLTLSHPDAILTAAGGTLQAGTLNVDAGRFNLLSTTLKNTVVTGGANGGTFVFGAGLQTLDNVTFVTDAVAFQNEGITINRNLTVQSTLTMQAGDYLHFNDCALLGTGQIVVDARPGSSNTWTSFAPASGSFAVGPAITIRTGVYNTTSSDAGAIVLSEFTNQGTISCQTAGMKVTLNGRWHNAGKLRLSAGTMVLNGTYSSSDIGDLACSGGTLVLGGTLDASPAPLRLNAATGSLMVNKSNLVDYASISNGRIECSDGSQLLVGGGTTAYLSTVTLAGTMQAGTGSRILLSKAFALDNGSVVMNSSGNSDPLYMTTLVFTTPTTIEGSGEIVFKGGSNNQIATNTDPGSGPATFGPGVTLRAEAGGATFRALNTAPITIQGQLAVNSGQVTLKGPVDVPGITQVGTSGVLLVTGGTGTLANLTNLNVGTLTGGAYLVGDAGTLRLPGTVVTNAARIGIQSTTANLYVGSTGTARVLDSLTTNDTGGVLELGTNVQLTLPNALLNRGTINVGQGAAFSASGGLMSPGALVGVGTILGDVRDGGRIAPGLNGSSIGTLRITGDLSLGSNGRVELGLGGNASGLVDHLAVTGSMNVAGTLFVSLANRYVPADGQSFDVLDFATMTGTFSTFSWPALANGLSWDTSRLYVDGTIRVVPEPASVTGVALIGVALLKRQRRKGSTATAQSAA